MKILVGADIAPTRSNADLFRAGDTCTLIGEKLKKRLAETDWIILNLETPLTAQLDPIVKAGENFAASPDTVRGLKAVNPYFFGLANNHILDQGEQGLFSTMKILDENHIAYAGAGRTPEDAAKPYIIEIKDVRIGIYLCAEHEYSIVSARNAGANPYDPLYSFDHVKELRKQCDLAIVLYHGGREHYRYPSPQLRRVFQKFAECGADVVIAQHTHCIGCKEKYKDSLLLYGQGNFLFDDTNAETEQTSLLLQIETDGREYNYSFLPLVKYGENVRLAEGKIASKIMDEFEKRSEEIVEDGFVEKAYRRYAKSQMRGYLSGVGGGFARIFPVRAVNKVLNYSLSERMYRGNRILSLENYINCETHREIMQEICKIEKEV